VHNPLYAIGNQGDFLPNGNYAYSGGWCASTWVYSDWAGNDGVFHYVLSVPATSGSNNYWAIYKYSSNSIFSRCTTVWEIRSSSLPQWMPPVGRPGVEVHRGLLG